jgi:hypothetical protein
VFIRISLTLDARNRKDLVFYLNRLVSFNRYLMRTREVPPLYQSGARYQREPRGQSPEIWQTCIQVAQSKLADCEDLVCYRTAELNEQGEHAMIRLTSQGKILHVTVRRGNGRIEDPSKILGMKPPRPLSARSAMI